MSSHIPADKEFVDPSCNISGRTADPEGDSAANKRAALAGQWRTPPMPAYPSGYSPSPGQHYQHPMQHPPGQATPNGPGTDSTDEMMSLNPTSLPGTSEDYAKALQDAYRKGAEAAARLAQQQQLPTAASCPNFSTGPHVAPPPALGSSAGQAQANGYQHHQMHPSTQKPVAVPDPLSSAMPPPPPTHLSPSCTGTTSTYTLAPPQQPQTVTYVPPPQPPSVGRHPHQYMHPSAGHPAAIPPPQSHGAATSPLYTAPSVAPQVITSTVPPPLPSQHQPSQASTVAGPTAASKPPQGRSLSMPDMSAYAAKAEEEKRQKRLARNRASARLRRLRKKNLVDAYETEVSILEKTLKQLQAHEWGKDEDHKTLLDALGMERGQQAIGPEQRSEIIRDILKQQMEQIELLRQAQVEQEYLAMVANMEENCDDEIARELQELLQLTDDQKTELRESSKGLDTEVKALETVTASLRAMQENDWLLNEGVQKITDQFTSILHKNQQSKFLLWTDANAEAIDQLDHVQVQPLQSAPIFIFGVETAPVDDDGKQ